MGIGTNTSTFNIFLDAIYFYTALATAGIQLFRLCRRRHCTVSMEASRRHVDVFLDLFTRKHSTRTRDKRREELSTRVSAPPFFFVNGLNKKQIRLAVNRNVQTPSLSLWICSQEPQTH